MNLLTKILNIIAGIFTWLPTAGRDFRTQRRENEQYHRQAMEEMRRTNDELLVRLTELYKEVVESKKEIAQLNLKVVKLTTENEKLSAQITQLTNELTKPKRKNRKKIIINNLKHKKYVYSNSKTIRTGRRDK